MTVVGAGAAAFLTNPPGWLEGIVAGVSAVGVALVASASKGLLMKLCNTNVRAALCDTCRTRLSCHRLVVRLGFGSLGS